ncbi:MAG: ATP-binding protein [Candidatus Cyclobacteriaceae bacterium M2_1C_046]
MEKNPLQEELAEKIEELDAQKEELTAAIEKLVEKNNELTRVNNELEKRNAEMDQLVYRTYHDLKSPIASMNGLIELLDMENRVEKLYLEKMVLSTQNMDKILKSLTVFVRNIREKIIPIAFDAEILLSKILSETSEAYDISKIKIEQEINKKMISTDAFRFELILYHLISNAINFQDPSSKQKRIAIFINGDDRMNILKITDNGIGMPGDILSETGNFFYRGSQISKGLGIGLYIVKSAVEKIKGKIKIESEEGKGTTVKVWIPDLPVAQL